MENIVKQTGFLFKLDPTDFVLGASPLDKPDISVTGDFTEFTPTGEKQYKFATFDTMSCTSFSFLNIFETLVKYLVKNNLFYPGQKETLNTLGFFASGEFNASDRALAIMSGTMPNGNYFQNVGGAAKNKGLVPEWMLPFGGNNQAEYLDPKLITKLMIDTGKKFLEIFEINYEWVVLNPSQLVNITAALKKGPLWLAIPNIGSHAVMGHKEGFYFDSYEPYVKVVDGIAYAMQVYVSLKKPATVWKYFKAGEFTNAQKTHTISELKSEFVDLMDKMRGECGFAWKIESGYRTVAENNLLPDSASNSAHTTREAVDIYCVDSRKRQILLDVVRKNGINRIGIGDTFIHIDVSKTLPQNVTWVY